MASISALHHVNIPAITAQSHSAQKPSAPSASVIGFIHTASFGSRAGPNKSPLRLPLKALRSRRSSFRIFAGNGDDGNERSGEMSSEGAPPSAATAIATAIEEEEESETKDLKRALMDSFYDTERGLTADSKKRAEIVELITQLEAKNPNPAPTEALNLLNGKWILVYTSPELFPLLAAGTLPFVKIKEISQKIDSETLTVQNYIQFAGPLATTSFSTNATFEVCSPKRVQIKIDEGIIATPQLTDSIEIPDSIEFLGQNIDLASFQGVITSVQNTASSVVRTISEQPPIKFPISSDRAQSWLLTTYLDKDLRISRGDGSSVFVLIKEGGPLMLPS